MEINISKAYIVWSCIDIWGKLSDDLKKLGFSKVEKIEDLPSSKGKLEVIAKEGHLIIVCCSTSDLNTLQNDVEHLLTNPSSPAIAIVPNVPDSTLQSGSTPAPYHFLTPDYTYRELSLCVASVCNLAKSSLASEGFFKTLVEHSVDGIALINHSGNILYANATTFEIFEADSNINFKLFNVKDIIDPIYHKELASDINRVSDYGESRKLEIQAKTLKGKDIWIEAIGSTITYKEQKAILVSFKVITEKKIANQKLQLSEEKYRMLIENANDAIVFIQNERIIFGNKQAKHIFGYSSADVEGKSFLEFIEPDERLRAKELYTKRLKGDDVPAIYETRILNKKGQPVDVDFNVNTTVYMGIPTTVVFIRDISYRRHAELSIKHSQESYRGLFDCSSDAILVLDPMGVILDINQSGINVFGYSRVDLLGNTIDYLSAGNKNLPENFDSILTSVLQGQSQLFEWWGKRFNTEEVAMEVLLNKGMLFGLDVVFFMARDISQRKQEEKELIIAKEKAEESDRLKTAFLSNMSHEIRSPMHAILGFLRLLTEEEKLSETGYQYVNQINSSGQQLICIIDDIIDVSKIQANQLKLKKKDFDLNAMLKELHSMYSTQLTQAGSTDVTIRPPKLDVPSTFIIHSDELRLRQVLTNLLGNAIKFTPKGEICFGYRFITDGEKANVNIFVNDTGIGIGKEKQKYVFDRFRQVDDSYTRLFGGAGLGLSISKGIVNLLGGDIWVDSQEGEGTQFNLLIPFIPPQSVSINSSNLLGGELANELGQWKDFKLLVVEDIPEIRFLLEKTLARTGAKIHFANNGEQARYLFNQHKDIDLVILDIRLPDTDGYTLAKEFKSLRSSVPIVAQTAYAMQEDKDKCLNAGCNDYITKPINPNSLIRKISNLLAKVED